MLAYLILLLIPLVYLTILVPVRNGSRFRGLPENRSMLLVFFFLYYLLLTLRASDVGVDTSVYLDKFRIAHQYSWKGWFRSSSWEPGFLLLTKLIASVSDAPQVYLAVLSAVVLSPIAWFYYKESEGPVLTLAIFLILPLFGIFFTALRQSIAIMMAVPAYRFARKRKLPSFLLTVLAAMLFHKSAFMLIFLYPVYHAKMPRNSIIWLLPVIASIYLFSGRIFRYLLAILSRLYENNSWQSQTTGAYAMLLLFGMLLVFSYAFTEEDETDEELLGLRNLMVLVVLLQCFASVHSLAMRMNYYYLLFVPLLIPKVIRRSRGSKAVFCSIASLILTLFFFLYFLSNVFRQSSSFGIYPYIPFWN